MIDKIANAVSVIRRYGLRGYRRRREWRRRQEANDARIADWLKTHGNRLSGSEIDDLRSRAAQFEHAPLISIVMPVYNVDERWLRAAIESVRRQAYENWELCIADDASPSPHVRRVLDEFAAIDNRIKVVYRESNGHISAASNSALELVTGEFTAFLDHDDELTDDALFRVVELVNSDPNAQMIYSDEDVIEEDGHRHSPKFKPDWSRDLFYSVNYATHFAVYRTSLVKQVGGFRLGFEGSQDYDLALRIIEQIDDGAIAHIPHILYHWRAIQGSVALAGSEKPYAHERARQAIREHFKRTGVDADVIGADFDLHRVSYHAKGTGTFEMISIAPDSADQGLDDQSLRMSNLAAKLNAAARHSDEDVLVFLDHGLIHDGPEALSELVGFAMQPGIGAVAGRIVAREKIVEDAGLVVASDLAPSAAHRGFPPDAPGNLVRNCLVSNFLAISTSCFAIRRELFEQMGGFDESLEIFDVDLCLRLRKRGKRIVVVPHVEFERILSPVIRKTSRRANAELLRRWHDYTGRDPFCNPNLKRDGSFELK